MIIKIANKISDFALDSKWRLFIVTNDCCNMHEAMLKFCHVISLSVINNENTPALLTWREYFINELLKILQVSRDFLHHRISHWHCISEFKYIVQVNKSIINLNLNLKTNEKEKTKKKKYKSSRKQHIIWSMRLAGCSLIFQDFRIIISWNQSLIADF